jgi:hypothetical protein
MWRFHLQTWSGKLIWELMITEGTKEKKQSLNDPAFSFLCLNIRFTS